MATASVSRWARRYVLTSALFLLVWQVGIVVGIPRRAEIFLGLYGFVLHMVFGKAYSLIPTYFNRKLVFSRAPAVQFPLAVLGTGSLVGTSLAFGPAWLGPLGGLLWSLGICIFLGTLLWTVRSNLSGRETATGEVNTERQPIDRLANAFIPIALCYLAVGTYETLAIYSGGPLLLDGYFPRVVHLLAAGTAGVLIFTLGFRLFPRFLVVYPPRWLVAFVLVTGAFGPLILAMFLWKEPWFQVGALIEAMAVIGFAIGYGQLFVQSNRRRVGFYAVLVGVSCGVIAVGVGLWFAFSGISPSLVRAHLRLNLLGFLGLSIVGVAYQFYPPAIGTLPGASNRTAYVSIGGLAGGLLAQVFGLVTHQPLVTMAGQLSTLSGGVLYVFLLTAVFQTR